AAIIAPLAPQNLLAAVSQSQPTPLAAGGLYSRARRARDPPKARRFCGCWGGVPALRNFLPLRTAPHCAPRPASCSTSPSLLALAPGRRADGREPDWPVASAPRIPRPLPAPGARPSIPAATQIWLARTAPPR